MIVDRRLLTWMIIAFMVLLLGSCEESQPSGPAAPGTFVGFLDRGAVVPDPVSTQVVIELEGIFVVSTQGGATIHSWHSAIERQEYDQMVSIVQDNHLFGAPDPTIGPRMCVGARELVIVIGADGMVDTLTVAGVSRCDTTTWPVGLGSLVGLKNALVTKYSPLD